MKRFLPALLLILLLAGCGDLYPNEYLYQAEHAAPYAFQETTSTVEETEAPLPEAGEYYQLRNILRSFVLDGTEHGQVLVRNYNGDLEQDLRLMVRYLTEQDPVSAYATDYISCERREAEDGWLIQMDAVYRRSVSEISSIRSVRGREAALQAMRTALREMQSSVTLQVSGYVQEDFAKQLTDYCLMHPEEIPEIPEITTAVYPDWGNVRVVEVHFVYQNDRETQRSRKAETESNLSAAYNYIRYARSDLRKLQLLYSYFTSRFPDQELKAGATVYTLLCQGEGDSRSFASVVRYLCERAGMEAYLVLGEREDAPYAWNIIRLEDRFVHVDFQSDALAGEGLTLRSDAEMTGYTWDAAAYPECEDPAAPAPTEPTEAETTEE